MVVWGFRSREWRVDPRRDGWEKRIFVWSCARETLANSTVTLGWYIVDGVERFDSTRCRL